MMKNNVYISMTGSLFCTAEIDNTVNQIYFKFKKNRKQNIKKLLRMHNQSINQSTMKVWKRGPVARTRQQALVFLFQWLSHVTRKSNGGRTEGCTWTNLILIMHIFYNDFNFFYYRWFTVFCQFCALQQNDTVTHTYTHSFSYIILHHAPSQVMRYSFQC